jgi:hypothetical protein
MCGEKHMHKDQERTMHEKHMHLSKPFQHLHPTNNLKLLNI